MSPFTRAAVTIAVAGMLTWSTAAFAREIEYHSATGCPSEADVARVIRERAPEGRDAHITIEHGAAGYRGELVLGDGDGRLVRAIDGKSCAAVVDALVLVVALDGRAETETAGDASPNADEAPPPAVSVVTIGGAAARDPDAALPEPPKRMDWSTGITVSGTTFAGNRPLTGGAIFFDVASEKRLLGVRLFRPSLRVSIARTLPSVVANDGATVINTHFQLTTASVEACPLGSALFDGRLTTAICGRWDLGALEASAGGGATETRLFDALGVQGRIRVSLTRPGTWRPVIELGAGILGPLARDRFHVLADAPLTVPAVLYQASLGFGVVLP